MALSWALHWCFCNFMNCVLCNGYWISFCRAAQASAFHQPLTRKYYILMPDCRLLFVFQYGLITMVGGGLTDRWRKTELNCQWTWLRLQPRQAWAMLCLLSNTKVTSSWLRLTQDSANQPQPASNNFLLTWEIFNFLKRNFCYNNDY